jgi:hypothetical protein
MFKNLMAEVESMKDAWGYDTLSAIEYILENRDEYSRIIQLELNMFLAQGSKMFSKETV